MANASRKPDLPTPTARPWWSIGGPLRQVLIAMLAVIGLGFLLCFLVRPLLAAPLLFYLLAPPPLLILLCLAITTLAVGVALRVRQQWTSQDALLHVLTIGAEQNMPLAPGLNAFAGLCGRSFRWRTQKLGHLLETGLSLPDALRRTPGVLSRPTALLASVGWSQGNLAGGLREAQAAESNRRRFRGIFLPKLAYLGGMFLFMQVIAGFILYSIAPKFQAIFADFGVNLPRATVLTIQVGHFFTGSIFGLVLLLTELFLLIYIPLLLIGVVRWEPPFSGWLSWRRDSASVLRSLAIGVEAGKPITDGLGLLGTLYPRGRIRRRLKRANEKVEQGADWLEALSQSGLIHQNDRAVLESAQRAGNLPWALRMQADAHERRLGYRLQIAAELLFPVVVLLAGTCVALFAVGYMLPLIKLIGSLAG